MEAVAEDASPSPPLGEIGNFGHVPDLHLRDPQRAKPQRVFVIGELSDDPAAKPKLDSIPKTATVRMAAALPATPFVGTRPPCNRTSASYASNPANRRHITRNPNVWVKRARGGMTPLITPLITTSG